MLRAPQAPPFLLDSLSIDGRGLHVATNAAQLFAAATRLELGAGHLRLAAPDPLLGRCQLRQRAALLERPELRCVAALLAVYMTVDPASAEFNVLQYELQLASPVGAAAEAAVPLMVELASDQLGSLLPHDAVQRPSVAACLKDPDAQGNRQVVLARGPAQATDFSGIACITIVGLLFLNQVAGSILASLHRGRAQRAAS